MDERRIQPIAGYLPGDLPLGDDPAPGLAWRTAFLLDDADLNDLPWRALTATPLFAALVDGLAAALGADRVAARFRSGDGLPLPPGWGGLPELAEVARREEAQDELRRVTFWRGPEVVGAAAVEDTAWAPFDTDSFHSSALAVVVFTPGEAAPRLVEGVQAAAAPLGGRLLPAEVGSPRPRWWKSRAVLLKDLRFLAVACGLFFAWTIFDRGWAERIDPAVGLGVALLAAVLLEAPARWLAARLRHLP